MQNNFVLGYLPFWVVTYGLALVAWSCLARFAMQAFVAQDSPNYIWRGFRWLTGWAVAAARRIVPSYVGTPLLPLVAAAWLFALRVVLGILMVQAGWAPRVTPPGAG